MKTIEINLYDGRDDVVLFAYLHDRSAPSGPRPAVVICPGGGLHVVSRSGSEGDDVALSFFADGYNAFILEYSVTSRAPEGLHVMPDASIDLGRALSAISCHADEWDTDPDALVVAGFSAGGWVAGLYATRWNSAWMREALACDPVAPRGALLVYSLLDCDFISKRMPRHDAKQIFGEETLPDSMWHRYSPAHNVTADTPPSFVTASFDDAAVEPGQSISFVQRLRGAGVPAELHLFELGNHAYGAARDPAQPWRDDKALSCGAWVPLAKTFLLHLLHPETKEGQSTSFRK